MLNIADNLKLPLEAVTQTFGILGKRGGGKTYTAKVIAEEMIRAGAHVACIDPIGNWWGLRVGRDGKSPGLPITVFGGDYGDVPLEATEKAGEFVARLIVEEKLSLVLDLSRFRKHEQMSFMIGWAETLYRLNREALHLFIDEADAWAPQRTIGNLAPRMLGAMEDLVRRGRARGLGITMITQRSASINKDLLTQIEVLIAKRTIAPQDRNAIEAWIEVHGTPHQQKTLMESLPSLPTEGAWFWSPGWLDIFKRVSVRKLETYDSSATPEVGKRQIQPRKLAQVDLEKLRERMASTIEKAKAEDPKQLQRQVRDLKTQVAKLESRKATAAPLDSKAIERARAQGAGIASKKLAGILRVFTQRVRRTANELFDALPAEADWVDTFHQVTTEEPRSTIVEQPLRKIAAGDNGEFSKLLGKGELKILTAIAQHDLGVTKEQLTVLTGYKRSSRDTYLQRLISRSLIQLGPTIRATTEGVAALGTGFEPLPTGSALREYWLGRLSRGERKILQILVQEYPDSVKRENLDAQIDYQRSSRDTYLQRLRSRQLVEDAGRGEVRASENLFD